jgi:hypothetical protein
VRTVEEDRAAQAAHSGFMPLGSWRLNLYASRAYYLETLGALFRQEIRTRPVRPEGEVDAEVYFLSRAVGSPDLGGGSTPPDGNVARWERRPDGGRELFTGRFRVLLREDGSPLRISLLVGEPQYSHRAFCDHLFRVVGKILVTLDRCYVHAGAVDLDDRVSVFVAGSGGGKTTACLRLAQEGATILSENHVLFARTGGGFVVSGCQQTARVTPKTERFIFGDQLAEGSDCWEGDKGKKEFRLERFFKSVPYRDFPFHRILFCHVGDRFRARSISRQEALLRLLDATKDLFRAGVPADLEGCLRYLVGLVEHRELIDLELSPDLNRLDELIRLLRR